MVDTQGQSGWGYLDATFAARYLPYGQKRNEGRKGKKRWPPPRGSWYLTVASGSLPLALLRLVIEGVRAREGGEGGERRVTVGG